MVEATEISGGRFLHRAAAARQKRGGAPSPFPEHARMFGGAPSPFPEHARMSGGAPSPFPEHARMLGGAPSPFPEHADVVLAPKGRFFPSPDC